MITYHDILKTIRDSLNRSDPARSITALLTAANNEPLQRLDPCAMVVTITPTSSYPPPPGSVASIEHEFSVAVLHQNTAYKDRLLEVIEENTRVQKLMNAFRYTGITVDWNHLSYWPHGSFISPGVPTITKALSFMECKPAINPALAHAPAAAAKDQKDKYTIGFLNIYRVRIYPDANSFFLDGL
jgi:hypothetical protein